MKNKKMHKVMIVAIAVLVMVSCILPAAAAILPENVIVIEGDVGDKVYAGDLVFEIVSNEEMDRVLSQPQTRASEKRWEITLSGTSMSKDFLVTKDYKYAKVWFRNDSPDDEGIVFNITRGTSTGTVMSGSSVVLESGYSISVYSSTAWSASTYYANFTCEAGLVGSALCRVASTKAELDI